MVGAGACAALHVVISIPTMAPSAAHPGAGCFAPIRPSIRRALGRGHPSDHMEDPVTSESKMYIDPCRLLSAPCARPPVS
jgi:hypothetical protein